MRLLTDIAAAARGYDRHVPQRTADVAAVKQRVTIIKCQICSRDFMTQDKVRVPDNRYALLFIWGEVENAILHIVYA